MKNPEQMNRQQLIDRIKELEADQTDYCRNENSEWISLSKKLIEEIQAGIIVANTEGNIIRINDVAKEVLGLDKDCPITSECMSQINFYDENENKLSIQYCPFHKVMETGKNIKNQYIGIRGPDNLSTSWVIMNAFPVYNQSKEISQIVLNFIDVTETRRLERSIKKNEEKFRTIFEGASVAIILIENDGKIALINKKAENMFGYQVLEIFGEPIEILVPDSYQKNHRKYCGQFRANPSNREMGARKNIYARKKNGDLFPVNIGLSGVNIEDENLTIAFIYDISEQKEAERKLFDSEKRYRSLVNAQNVIIVRISLDSRITFMNLYTLRLLGLSEDAGYRQNLTDIFNFKNPEKADRYLENIFRSQSNFSNPYRFQSELQIQTTEGNKIFLWQSSEILDRDGQLIEIQLVANDVTELKESQKKIQDLYQSVMNDLETANQVQSYMTPPWIEIGPGYHVSSIYMTSSSIGGDVLDILQLNDRLSMIFVGDISGHGIQAALLVGAVKSVIRMIVADHTAQYISPSQILKRLNEMMYEELFRNNHMTAVLGIYDAESGQFLYYNAGHPPLFLFRNGQLKEMAFKGGIPIGWKKNFDYSAEDEDEIFLEPGDTLLIYTDGIFECEKDGSQLGLDGFRSWSESILNSLDSPVTYPNDLTRKLKDNGYEVEKDDYSLIGFRRIYPNKLITKNNFVEIWEHQSGRSVDMLIKPLLKAVGTAGQYCYEKIYSIDKTLAAKTELVTNEILNNIILHGLNNFSQETVLLNIFINAEQKKLQITFWDRGREFNTEKINQIKDSIEENDPMKTSGRGLEIIHTLSLSYHYERYGMMNKTTVEIGCSDGSD